MVKHAEKILYSLKIYNISCHLVVAFQLYQHSQCKNKSLLLWIMKEVHSRQIPEKLKSMLRGQSAANLHTLQTFFHLQETRCDSSDW